MLERYKVTEADLMFPEQSFDYQGLTVVVRGLPARKVLKLASLCQTLRKCIDSSAAPGRAMESRAVTAEVLLAIRADMIRLLEESVEIHGADLGVLDLPFRMFPKLLEKFIGVNIDLGNWSALGRALGIKSPVSSLIESLIFRPSLPAGQRC